MTAPQQPDVAGAVLALDQAMIALAVAKSTLLGEVGRPVPLASLRDRGHYDAGSAAEVAEGVEPELVHFAVSDGVVQCGTELEMGRVLTVDPRLVTCPGCKSGAYFERVTYGPVPTPHLPQHTGGHPECTAPGCGQPGHHLHAATIPADGA